MNRNIIAELEKEQIKAEKPQFNVGDTVRVANRMKAPARGHRSSRAS